MNVLVWYKCVQVLVLVLIAVAFGSHGAPWKNINTKEGEESIINLYIDPVHQAEQNNDELESKKVVAKSVFNIPVRSPPSRCPPGHEKLANGDCAQLIRGNGGAVGVSEGAQSELLKEFYSKRKPTRNRHRRPTTTMSTTQELVPTTETMTEASILAKDSSITTTTGSSSVWYTEGSTSIISGKEGGSGEGGDMETLTDATTKATTMETAQQVETLILGGDGLMMNLAHHKNSEETKGSNLENDKEPVSSSSETEHTSQLPRVTDSTVKLIEPVENQAQSEVTESILTLHSHESSVLSPTSTPEIPLGIIQVPMMSHFGLIHQHEHKADKPIRFDQAEILDEIVRRFQQHGQIFPPQVTVASEQEGTPRFMSSDRPDVSMLDNAESGTESYEEEESVTDTSSPPPVATDITNVRGTDAEELETTTTATFLLNPELSSDTHSEEFGQLRAVTPPQDEIPATALPDETATESSSENFQTGSEKLPSPDLTEETPTPSLLLSSDPIVIDISSEPEKEDFIPTPLDIYSATMPPPTSSSTPQSTTSEPTATIPSTTTTFQISSISRSNNDDSTQRTYVSNRHHSNIMYELPFFIYTYPILQSMNRNLTTRVNNHDLFQTPNMFNPHEAFS